MPAENPRIIVTSPSFSKNRVLRKKLESFFPNARFNESGGHYTSPELIEALKPADAAIVGLEPIDETVLSACPGLEIISKYGVGLDNIDLEACRRHNVTVGWTGGLNRRSVAELALAFMIGLCRNVFHASTLLRSGNWRKEGGFQLSGKTVGIIGIGHIGKEVAHLLEPFQCTVLANDIIEQNDYYRDHGLVGAGKEEIWDRADIVTLHVPLTPLTHHLANADVFKRMKPEAFLINTARGNVVHQNDLKQALIRGDIAGAAIDVYESEPPDDTELLSLPNFVGTPHIGGNAREAILAMGNSAIGHLREFYGDVNDG